MKIFQQKERTDEGQQDCFWHDHSTALKYILVLPGVVYSRSLAARDLLVAQRTGRVTNLSREYCFVAATEPASLPGTTGPITIMLIL